MRPEPIAGISETAEESFRRSPHVGRGIPDRQNAFALLMEKASADGGTRGGERFRLFRYLILPLLGKMPAFIVPRMGPRLL